MPGIKIGFEVTCLVITACMTFFCLGHIMGLGIGTIVAAFTMGKGIAITGTGWISVWNLFPCCLNDTQAPQ